MTTPIINGNTNIQRKCLPRLAGIPSILPAAAMVLVFMGIAPMAAHAESRIALSHSAGEDDYQSNSVNGSVDLFKLPLQVDADYFSSKLGSTETTKEVGLGLTWRPATWASGNYRHSWIDDGNLDVTGNEAGVGLNLHPIWESELITRLDISFGTFDYRANPLRPGVQALLTNRVLKQRRYQLGVYQDLTDDVTLHASHVRYDYSRDPKALAEFLIKRTGFSTQGPSTLLSFPDQSSTIGLEWRPADDWVLDLSYSATKTVIDQKQDNVRLDLEYHATRSTTLNVALSHGRSGDIKNAAGTVLLPSSSGATLDIGIAYSFK